MLRTFLRTSFIFFSMILCALPARLSFSANVEIPGGLVWFNTDKPLSIAALKGKFVLVHFWNHGGMNLRSALDQYRQLQEKFPRELVVIGIHSGKELDEDTINARVADAVTEERIAYPVAVDPGMTAFKSFLLDRWPTAILFAPDGSRLFAHTGERDIFSLFSRLIAKKLPRYEGTLNREPVVVLPAQTDVAAANPDATVVAPSDLAVKSLAKDLLGETVLDTAVDAPAHGELSDELSTEMIRSTEEDGQPQKVFKPVSFDEKHYVGEIIRLGREYSRKIGKLIVDLSLGDNARWQTPGQSYVRVFTEDGTVLTQALIGNAHMELLIKNEVNARRLYAEFMVYYCAEGAKSACFMRPVVFRVPLADYPKYEDIKIRHRFSSERL